VTSESHGPHTFQINVFDNDDDVNGDGIALTSLGSANVEGVTLSIADANQGLVDVTFEPGYDNYPGDVTFDYTVTDDYDPDPEDEVTVRDHLTGTATVTIHLTNDAPEANGYNVYTNQVDGDPIEVSTAALGSDDDSDDFYVSGDFSNEVGGTASVGSLVWDPDSAANYGDGMGSVDVALYDEHGEVGAAATYEFFASDSANDINGSSDNDILVNSAGPLTPGDGWVQWAAEDNGNDHWYKFVGDEAGWNAARAAADDEVNGGHDDAHLATVTSEEENGFVQDLAFNQNGEDGEVWLGGTDRDSEGNWHWVDTGEDFDYTNWAGGQPDDSGASSFWGVEINPGEDYLEMFQNGEWNDEGQSIFDYSENAYVLELEGFDDVVHLNGGAGSDILVGGAGEDEFIIDGEQGASDVDTILGFTDGEDTLDIGDLLSDLGYNEGGDNIEDWVSVSDNGSSSTVSVSTDGGSTFDPVAVVDGVLSSDLTVNDDGTIV
jgi:hypothetical protein